MYTAQGIVKPKRLEFDKKNKTSHYGKFIAGPFERGYGVTIGNSLRRMLLSSIEGAAIVKACMERKLLVNCTQNTVMRMLPAMVTTQEQANEACDIFAEVLKEQVV